MQEQITFKNSDQLLEIARNYDVEIRIKNDIGQDYINFFNGDIEKLSDYLALPNVKFDIGDLMEFAMIDQNLASLIVKKYRDSGKDDLIVDKEVAVLYLYEGMSNEDLFLFIMDLINKKDGIDLSDMQKRLTSDLFFFLDHLSPEKFRSIPLKDKKTPPYKKYVHNKIIETAMALRGQFPSLMLAQIIRESIDTSAFTEDEVLLLITPINERRELSKMERSTIQMKPEVKYFNKIEKFLVEEFPGVHYGDIEDKLENAKAQGKNYLYFGSINNSREKFFSRQNKLSDEEWYFFDNGFAVQRGIIEMMENPQE